MDLIAGDEGEIALALAAEDVTALTDPGPFILAGGF